MNCFTISSPQHNRLKKKYSPICSWKQIRPKKRQSLKASETARRFSADKTWWLCPQCKLYRLCTDHCTDGVSIPEHEGECAQAIENTSNAGLFSPIPWERFKFFNSISQYVLYCIRNHYLWPLSKTNMMTARRTWHGRGQNSGRGQIRKLLFVCSLPPSVLCDAWFPQRQTPS
jgi:hypothetical protein